jgi:hypothetical protein
MLLLGGVAAAAGADRAAANPLPDKEITAFSFDGITPAAVGVIDETAHTIAVDVPAGTDVTALVATFTHTGRIVTLVPSDLLQESGVTANDFTDPVTYRVEAWDTTHQEYVVTVTKAVPSSAKAITAFSFQGLKPPAIGVIRERTHSIRVSAPRGTNVRALVATFTTTGASVWVGGVQQQSGVTANDFRTAVRYMVEAADQSLQGYLVTVVAQPTPHAPLRLPVVQRKGKRTAVVRARMSSPLAYSRVRAALQRKQLVRSAGLAAAGTRWVTVKTVAHRPNAHGKVMWKLRVSATAEYRVRISVRKNGIHPAYRTRWVVVPK